MLQYALLVLSFKFGNTELISEGNTKMFLFFFFCFVFLFFVFLFLFLFLFFFSGHLRLDPGVVIHQADSVVIAQKNSPLLIDCSATSSSDAGHATYKWHKNGKPVVTDKFLQTLSNGSLFFPLVKNNFKSKNRNKNHNGFYECFLKNKYGTVIARQVRLNVASKYYVLKVQKYLYTIKLSHIYTEY